MFDTRPLIGEHHSFGVPVHEKMISVCSFILTGVTGDASGCQTRWAEHACEGIGKDVRI
jgi:hypothetical protein